MAGRMQNAQTKPKVNCLGKLSNRMRMERKSPRLQNTSVIAIVVPPSIPIPADEFNGDISNGFTEKSLPVDGQSNTRNVARIWEPRYAAKVTIFLFVKK